MTVEPDLKKLEVLAFDCQATKNDPAKGHILEMGWERSRADMRPSPEERPFKSEFYLIQTPEPVNISPRILSLTGIQPKELETAQHQTYVWKRLIRSAEETVRASSSSVCPMIIHYCGYEMPFLKKLYKEHPITAEFPFDIICTHRIIQLLLPGLPRKGLRAAAGYFGHSLPSQRR